MNEWNLPTDKTIILLVILFKIVWKIWNRPSPIKLVEEKEKVEVSKGLNPDYGASVLIERGKDMELLSKEIQLEWLQTQKETLETLVNLEMERKGKLDLITREELKEALGVSGETLRNWEMMGLQRFQTPMERARKVYYRPSDIYLFLSVR